MIEILNVFGINLTMMLIQAVNFSIVLGILWYFLYTPLMKMIEKRRADTIEAVANAERAANDLAEADTKKKEILTEATLTAEDMLKSARLQAKETEEQIISEAQGKSEDILSEAHTIGEETKKRYLDQSKDEIAKLVVLGIEKTLRNR